MITEELSNFVNNIDKTNEITITKSILKQFNFTFYYRNNITSYNHINCFLYSLIEMYFYLDLIELFTLDDELSDEMLEYLEKFDSKENKLYINKKINNKNFINLLIENNIVKALTNLYNDVVNFIEDTERENILEKEVVTQ